MTAKPVSSIPDSRAEMKSPPRIALDQIFPVLLDTPGTAYLFYEGATKNQARNLVNSAGKGPLKPPTGTLKVAMRRNKINADNGEAAYDLYAVYEND